MKSTKLKKQFAIIGVAGYVAPRHLTAIKETGGELVAAYDPNDSVGVLDSYFPEADFFTAFERFDRHIYKLKVGDIDKKVSMISICSPNHLHDAHLRFALRSGADAICEKPIVLNPRNIEPLMHLESETGKKIFTVLQLRLHPAIIALKQYVTGTAFNSKYEVDLTYITARGKWYFSSWKGDIEKSGGVSTNIGIHFFDMLYFVFGKIQEVKVTYRDKFCESGYIECERARVRWFLSVNEQHLPDTVRKEGGRSYRNITVNGKDVEFTKGFFNLHTKVYEAVLAGKGFTLEENIPAIEAVSIIRTQKPRFNKTISHPFLTKQAK